jgi:predicted dehydrogenase
VGPFFVEGDAGTVELDPYQEDALIVTTSSEREQRSAHPGRTPAEAYSDRYIVTQGHFADCLHSGVAAENEARDNLKAHAAVMAAYASAERGLPVPVIV